MSLRSSFAQMHKWMWPWIGRAGTTRWTCGERQTPTDMEWLLPGPGTGQWLQGAEVLRALVGGIRDLTDPRRKPHQEEAQGLGRLLRTLKPLPMHEDASLLGKPRGLTQPQAQPHKPTLRPSEQPPQGSPGKGLRELMGVQTSLPRDPIPAPNPPSCCLQGAVISVLPLLLS